MTHDELRAYYYATEEALAATERLGEAVKAQLLASGPLLEVMDSRAVKSVLQVGATNQADASTMRIMYGECLRITEATAERMGVDLAPRVSL